MSTYYGRGEIISVHRLKLPSTSDPSQNLIHCALRMNELKTGRSYTDLSKSFKGIVPLTSSSGQGRQVPVAAYATCATNRDLHLICCRAYFKNSLGEYKF